MGKRDQTMVLAIDIFACRCVIATFDGIPNRLVQDGLVLNVRLTESYKKGPCIIEALRRYARGQLACMLTMS
jgi:hypothetical protein